MNRNNEFTAPVYLLIPLLFVQLIVLSYLLYIASYSLEQERLYEQTVGSGSPAIVVPNSSGAFIAQSIHAAVVILVLIGEAMLLWRIRNKKYNRWLSVGYLLPLALALGLLPILAVQEGLWSHVLVPAPFMYWTAIILAHLFFWMIIRQARNSHNSRPPKPQKQKDAADGDWVEELHELID